MAASFGQDDWYRALTIVERIHAPGGSAEPTAGVDRIRVERRMARWRSSRAFNLPGGQAGEAASAFERRLHLDGLTEATLADLLAEEPAQIKARVGQRPAWMAVLADVYGSASGARPAAAEDGAPEGFIVAVWPLVSRARARLRERVQEIVRQQPGAPFGAETADRLLLPALIESIERVLRRTLVLEMHVARLREQLAGETAEQRYASFLRRLQDPAVVRALFQEYPVLARQVVERLELWIEASTELLERLASDWPLIVEHLAERLVTPLSEAADPGTLTEIHGGAGDGHRGGRSVTLLGFASGFRLVYKPRALAVEVHFQQLLAWVNERANGCGLPQFGALQILDRGEYGWVEAVAAAPCESPAAVERFYERLGGLLALLSALAGTDIHTENLMAVGEQPVLIDLETLFHGSPFVEDGAWTVDPAAVTLQESVVPIGLLPFRAWAHGGRAGVDLSGLGAEDGQRSAYDLPSWQAPGTDEMRLVRAPLTLEAGQSRPILNGEPADPVEYADAFERGFAAMYRLLLQQRDTLLAKHGPLIWFVDDEIRLVVRPTSAYAALLREGCHPDVLRDGLDRDRLFDHLWGAGEQFRQAERLIAAERADLYRGDVPMFVTGVGSTDVRNGCGLLVPGLLPESGLDLVRGRLAGLSEADLTRQLRLIRATLATMMSARRRPRAARSLPRPSDRPFDRGQALAAALEIGERIASLAETSDGRVGNRVGNRIGWIGITNGAGDTLDVAPLGLNLYDGLPGVALFLAELGTLAAAPRFTALARSTVETVGARLVAEAEHETLVGAFEGWGGLIYSFARLGTLWHDRSLHQDALNMVAPLRRLVEGTPSADLSTGLAGAVVSLLALHAATGDAVARALAVQCGSRLLADARPNEHGLAWLSSVGEQRPLGGFAHGAGGVAWALHRLAQATGEARFERAALDADAYQTWLLTSAARVRAGLADDALRAEVDASMPRSILDSWCWGAAGVGLTWARAGRLMRERQPRAGLTLALDLVLADRPYDDDTLCHGTFGEVDLLLEAAAGLGDDRLRTEAERRALAAMADVAGGWRCSAPLGVESPGLMTGLAGIGYGLLRVTAPDAVPSVLLLDPPVGAPIQAHAERLPAGV